MCRASDQPCRLSGQRWRVPGEPLPARRPRSPTPAGSAHACPRHGCQRSTRSRRLQRSRPRQRARISHDAKQQDSPHAFRLQRLGTPATLSIGGWRWLPSGRVPPVWEGAPPGVCVQAPFRRSSRRRSSSRCIRRTMTLPEGPCVGSASGPGVDCGLRQVSERVDHEVPVPRPHHRQDQQVRDAVREWRPSARRTPVPVPRPT
jgi:hypothetical protein